MQLTTSDEFLSYIAREYNSNTKVYGMDKNEFRQHLKKRQKLDKTIGDI